MGGGLGRGGEAGITMKGKRGEGVQESPPPRNYARLWKIINYATRRQTVRSRGILTDSHESASVYIRGGRREEGAAVTVGASSPPDGGSREPNWTLQFCCV